MSNSSRLFVACLFMVLGAAGAAGFLELANRYGAYTASMIAIGGIWIVGMLGVAISDALLFCAERSARKRNRRP